MLSDESILNRYPIYQSWLCDGFFWDPHSLGIRDYFLPKILKSKSKKSQILGIGIIFEHNPKIPKNGIVRNLSINVQLDFQEQKDTLFSLFFDFFLRYIFLFFFFQFRDLLLNFSKTRRFSNIMGFKILRIGIFHGIEFLGHLHGRNRFPFYVQNSSFDRNLTPDSKNK